MSVVPDDEVDMDVEEPVPCELNAYKRSQFLDVSKDMLTVRYMGNATHKLDVGSIQANHPAPKRQVLYYFEVYILDQGEYGRIGIGFSDKKFKLGRQPGWEPGSYGYHGDNGHKYSGYGLGSEYGPKFTTGDIAGACLHLEKQEIFFTKNGKHLGVAFTGVKPAALFPTIGLHSKNEWVEVNFGTNPDKPFKFDIQGFIQSELDRRNAEVNSVSVSTGTTHQFVRDYLVYYGYADTLNAFDAAAGLERGTAPHSSTATTNKGHCTNPKDSSLACRNTIRKLLLQGEMDGAVSLLSKHYPQLMEDTQDNLLLKFWVSCQQYIELIRAGKVVDALQFAQCVLAHLNHMTHKVPSPHLDAEQLEVTLTNVVALIAYEDVEHCPFRSFLGLSQRERVADVVNAAILSHLCKENSEPNQASIDIVLQQLVCVQRELWEAKGQQGVAFRLQDVMKTT